MDHKQKVKLLVISLISFVAGIFVIFSFVLNRSNRPLEPLLNFLKQSFPAYKDSSIIDIDHQKGYGIGPYKDSLGLRRYKYQCRMEIQLDITNVPNVYTRNLCNYYLQYLESSGLLNYGSFNSENIDKDFTLEPAYHGGFEMFHNVNRIGRNFQGYAYSNQGFIKIACIIADNDGKQILPVSAGYRNDDEKNADGLQGRRIAWIGFLLSEGDFTTSGGLLK